MNNFENALLSKQYTLKYHLREYVREGINNTNSLK